MKLIKTFFRSLSLALILPLSSMAQGNADGSAALTKKKAVQQVNFVVNMSTPDKYTAGTKNGIYTLSTTDLTPQLLVQDSGLEANAGGAIDGDVIYFQRYSSSEEKVRSYSYNFSTQTYSENGTDRGKAAYYAVCSPAYDKATKRAYGMYYHADSYPYEIAYVDYNNWTRVKVASVNMENYVRPIAMAATNDGKCYAIGYFDGALYSFNKQTGEFSMIGSTGFMPGIGKHSACIDSRTNKLYWVGHLDDDSYSMIEVDLSTAASQKVGTIRSSLDINVMAVEEQSAAAEAPIGVSNFKAVNTLEKMNDFAIDFDLPTKTFAGNDLTGQVNYIVLLDNQTIKNGQAPAGQHVAIQQNNISTGSHEIKVIVSNSAGASPDDIFKIWSGPDVLAAPKDVRLTIEGNQATVSWTAPPMQGLNGGLIDPSKVTYAIMQLPEQQVVAQGLTTTSWITTIDTEQLRYYTFLVRAVHQGMQSNDGATQHVKVGEYIIPPYFENFSDLNTIYLYTIIDANGDGSSWGIGNQNEVGYVFNENNRADDWLVTPPLKMQQGKQYRLSFKASCDNEAFPEKLEVFMGKANTAAAMTTELLPAFEISHKDYRTYSADFTVDTDGLYYIGFHCISNAFHYYLWMTDLSIEVTETSAPAAPAVEIENAPNGALSATLHITAPTTTGEGTPLQSISSIEVTRSSDGKTVATKNNPAPGATFDVYDNFPNEGSYTYTVVAYNAAGRGEATIISTFVGRDYPAPPSNFRIVDNGDNTAVLMWDKADGKGARGGFADPEGVTYKIFPIINGYLQPEIDQTTDNVYDAGIADIDTGKQDLLMYAISAFNDYGESQPVIASLVVGDKDELPYKESFKGRSLDHIWSFDSEGAGDVELASESSEGDGGSIALNTQMRGDVISLMSGKIDMRTAVKPKLVFDYFATPGADATLTILANVEQNAEPNELLKTIDFKSLSGEAAWRQEIIDIDALSGANYAVFIFRIEAKAATHTLIDNIQVYSTSSRDFSASLTAPMAGRVNSSQSAIVEVSNLGAEAAADYKVQLVATYQTVDGQGNNVVRTHLLGEQQGSELAAYTGKAQFRFEFSPSAAWQENTTIKGVVIASADQQADNNESTSTFYTVQNDLPAINDLVATEATDPMVNLKWTSPGQATTILPVIVTETFDNTTTFPAFSVGGITETNRYGELGDWMLYDGDNELTYVSAGSSTYEHAGERMAWQVFRPEVVFDNVEEAGFMPHSGSQYLLSMCPVVTATVGARSADWIVSPELTGKRQIVSFYTKAPTQQFGNETYEVYYSDTDRQLSNFKHLGSFSVKNTAWEQNGILLPDGAKYFAIKHTTFNALGLMLDDVSFEQSSGSAVTLPVTGYRIYVNDVCVGEINGSTTVFDTALPEPGTYSFNVTALYGEDKLESPLSNTPVIVGINEVNGDKWNIADASLTVYSTSGQVVATGKNALSTLSQGVYIVRDNATGKTMTIRK